MSHDEERDVRSMHATHDAHRHVGVEARESLPPKPPRVLATKRAPLGRSDDPEEMSTHGTLPSLAIPEPRPVRARRSPPCMRARSAKRRRRSKRTHEVSPWISPRIRERVEARRPHKLHRLQRHGHTRPATKRATKSSRFDQRPLATRTSCALRSSVHRCFLSSTERAQKARPCSTRRLASTRSTRPIGFIGAIGAIGTAGSWPSDVAPPDAAS